MRMLSRTKSGSCGIPSYFDPVYTVSLGEHKVPNSLLQLDGKIVELSHGVGWQQVRGVVGWCAQVWINSVVMLSSNME